MDYALDFGMGAIGSVNMAGIVLLFVAWGALAAYVKLRGDKPSGPRS